MQAALALAEGPLAAGDRLYLATDAVAEWMVRADAADAAALWPLLDRLDPAGFHRLVADRRRAGVLKNDDATLMRVRVTDRESEHLAVCR
jgi:hypothetical protein